MSNIFDPLPSDVVSETIQTDSNPAKDTSKQWAFILDYPRPPKGLHANDRPNRWVKAGAVADVRMEVMARTRALNIGVRDRIRIDVTWVVGDKRKRDQDGPDPFCKAIYDGIAANKGVSAHVVDDDDPAHVDKPRLTIRYEKGARPHFEVRITEVTA